MLFMGGTLVISMAMQLDRRGLWNLLGPVLFSLVIMVTAWVSLAFTLLVYHFILILSTGVGQFKLNVMQSLKKAFLYLNLKNMPLVISRECTKF